MKRERKEILVEELSRELEGHSSIILTDFTGIDVKGITVLRRTLKENQATLRVVKNTLLKRAVAKSSTQGLAESLEGPTALVLSDDAVSGARALVDFARKEDKPRIKVALIEGNLLDPEEVKKIASLPTKPVLLSMLIAGINAPLVQTVNVLRAILLKLILVTQALRDLKEKEDQGTPKS
ncbi:MAG: 50S ribosomal protein L10 [Candidatus Glassbacteria bacterium]